jgi:hypothetical protein
VGDVGVKGRGRWERRMWEKKIVSINNKWSYIGL